MHAHPASVTKELKQCWNAVKQDPWWQSIFMAVGLQYEIPPNVAADASASPVVTPPRKGNKDPPPSPACTPPPKGNKDPPPLDQPSPSDKPSAPKRVQKSRPATIGQPRLEDPILKPVQRNAPKHEAPPEVDDSLLDLMSDEED